MSNTTTPDSFLQSVAYSDVTALSYSEADTVLKYGKDENQHIEVWAANEKTDVHPMLPGILLVHGGCWMKEFSVDHARPLATALSKEGFNVFAIEYRRTGQDGGGWPGSVEDVSHAMAFIRDEYPKMALSAVGHSAGGHLALLAATDPSLRLNAVIGLAAITDIAAYSKGDSSCEQGAVKFMGGTVEQKPAEYKLADTRNKRIVFPLYLLSSSDDEIVPIEQNNHRQARRFDGQGIGHFDWIHPESLAFQHLKNTLAQLYE